ncbi:MAG: OB-fold nucleic acid binding domain-containing protein [Candidatus Norongarragalinales archaeon]
MDEEGLLKEKLGDSLERRISEKQKAFSGLLTREGALKLVALDEGVARQTPRQSALSKLSQALNLQEGSFASVVVRIKQVYCAREFEREGRKGRVCNAIVADETAEGKIVFWNGDADFAERKLERNACVKAEGLVVKNGELHSNLFSSFSFETAPLGYPDFAREAQKLSIVSEGGDFYARVAAKGVLREFERNGEKGAVLNLTIEDGSAQKTLVCWGRNAAIANFLKEGDVVKAEGISVKNGEFHASWMTHLIPHAKKHNLKELEFKPFTSLVQNETAFVRARIERLFEARVSRKCVSCGGAVGEGSEKCDCGGSLRSIFFITAQAADVQDETQKARMVFFEDQAKELLGLKQTLVSPQTLFELKRGFVEGKALKFKVLVRTGQNGVVEMTVKQIRSL